MRLVPLLFVLATPLVSMAQPATAPGLLATMRNHDRPVLLFAGPDDPRIDQEYGTLRVHAAELQDRQMRLVLVTRSRTADDAPMPEGAVAVTDVEAKALRSRFHVAANQFTVLLLGRDGGEKFRSTHVVSFDTLRTLVDEMPMRRQEMRRR